MKQKIEARFKCEYELTTISAPDIKAFLENTIPSLKITHLKLVQKPSSFRVIVESNLKVLLSEKSNEYRVLTPNLAKLTRDISEYTPISERLRRELNEMVLEIASLIDRNKEFQLKFNESISIVEFEEHKDVKSSEIYEVKEIMENIKSIIAKSNTFEDRLTLIISEQKEEVAKIKGIKAELGKYTKTLSDQKTVFTAILKKINSKGNETDNQTISELIFSDEESSLVLYKNEDEVRLDFYKDELSTAYRTINELNELIKAKDKELSELDKEVKKLLEENKVLGDDSAKLKEQVETLTKNYNEIFKELTKLKEQPMNSSNHAKVYNKSETEKENRKETDKLNEKLKMKLESKEEDIKGLANKDSILSELKEEVNNYKAKIDAEDKEITKREIPIKEEAQLLKTTILKEKNIEELKEKSLKLEESIKKYIEIIQKVREEKEKLFKSEVNLKENIRKYVEIIKSLETYIKELEARQKGDSKKFIEEIHKAKEVNDKLVKREVMFNETIRKQNEEVQVLKIKNNELVKLEAMLKEFIKECTKEVQNITEENHKLAKSESSLRKELRECIESNKKAKEDNDKLNKVIALLTEDIKKREKEINNLEVLKKYINEIALLKDNNKELVKSETILKKELSKVTEELKYIKATLNHLNQKHAAELSTLNAHKEELMKSEEILKGRIHNYVEEIKGLKLHSKELVESNKKAMKYNELKEEYEELKAKYEGKSKAYDDLVKVNCTILKINEVRSLATSGASCEEVKEECSKILQSKDEGETSTKFNSSSKDKEVAGNLTELEVLQEKIRVYESLVGGLKSHEIVAETLQTLNLRNVKLREEIEGTLSYKEDYENLKKLNQNLSEELNSMKASAIWDLNKMSHIVVGEKKEESKVDRKTVKKQKIIKEIKEYLKEILYAYNIIKSLIKERVAAIKDKQVRITEYANKIEEIKRLTNKNRQLKLIKELKESIPFMSALTLSKSNIKAMFLGMVAEGNDKFARLTKYANEIEKYNDITKVIKERYPMFEAKLNIYEAAITT